MIFAHDGDYGDTIAAMALMRELGGGDLLLFPTNTREPYTPQRVAGIASLLERQPYVSSVRFAPNPDSADVNLGAWRFNYKNGLNLCDMYFNWIKKPHPDRDQPWMWVEPNPIAEVVFARSARYHGDFPWRRAVKKYAGKSVFIGLPVEHGSFCREFGDVPYQPTTDMHEAARVLAGAKLVLVNQTSLFWVAEALKRPLCLEACAPPHHNCHFDRTSSFYCQSEAAILPDPDQLDDLTAYVCAERDLDRSLLSKEKRLGLARCALECAGLPGSAAEVGVFKGGSAAIVAAALPTKTVRLYDTFTGAPAPEGHHRQGDFACGLEDVRKFLAGYNVEYHPGTFPQTAVEDSYCFVHLDCDLYASTRDALAFFWPRMVPGGIIVLDDVDWEPTPGVNRAIEESGLRPRMEWTASHQMKLKKT